MLRWMSSRRVRKAIVLGLIRQRLELPERGRCIRAGIARQSRKP